MSLTPREEEAFLLCFASSFWKRSIRCMYLYCQIKHEEKEENFSFSNTNTNEIELVNLNYKPNAKLLLKCVKYNLLAPTGAYGKMKEYLEKIYSTGFLLPSEFKEEELVNRAISLFSSAYLFLKDTKKSHQDGPNGSISKDLEYVEPDYDKFTHDFASTVKTDGYDYEFDEKEEILDYLSEKQFCNLVDSWDIHPSLFSISSDSIQGRFVVMLTKTLKP